jgi:hypothetical protein
MKITNKQLVFEAMVRIQDIQNHIKAIEEASYYLQNRDRQIRIDYGNIRSLLIDRELDEWRGLMMWGLTLDDQYKDRIKAAAHARFLHDGISVSHWLNQDGVSPASWFEADEIEFRKMAKTAFGPKGDQCEVF